MGSRLKRMVVSDESLGLLSRSFLNFKSLVLVSCEGLTTDGLAAIAANCSKEISRPAGKPSCLTELTGQPSCSTELTVTRDVINHSGYSNGKLPHKACQRNEKVVISLGHDSKWLYSCYKCQNKKFQNEGERLHTEGTATRKDGVLFNGRTW
ncbi:hypothetical protein ABKV19_026216, partial [Rosa sericea]